MLKKLWYVVAVLAVVGAAVGGYYVRPQIDLRYADYPVIQESALHGVKMYEYVAEKLADYPVYHEEIEHVVLEYNGIMTKIEDVRLLEAMEDDWRYKVVESLESEFPFVQVINIRMNEPDMPSSCVAEIYFDAGYMKSLETTMAVLETRLEVTAKAVELLSEYCSDCVLGIAWANVVAGKSMNGPYVRATIGAAIAAPDDLFLAWAQHPKEELFAELEVLLEMEGTELFVDSPWSPTIYVEEELPRLSTDPAPWDQEYFFEE